LPVKKKGGELGDGDVALLPALTALGICSCLCTVWSCHPQAYLAESITCLTPVST
jgi:hypothetical protein